MYYLGMKHTINFDEKMLISAMQISGINKKTKVVHLALQQFVENQKKMKLIDSFGRKKISLDPHERNW